MTRPDGRTTDDQGARPELAAWRSAMLGVAAKPFGLLPPGRAPSRVALRTLQLAWGNLGYAAGFYYLRRAVDAAVRSGGSVLECGSGLTTILLGLLGRRNGYRVTTLEHDAAWHRRVRGAVDHLRLENVDLVHAPLKDYGAFEWYDVADADLQRAYAMVLCDGPPGRTRGGRVGMLPVVGHRLTDDAVILLDDAHRKQERRVLEQWTRRFPLVCRHYGLVRRVAELRVCRS